MLLRCRKLGGYCTPSCERQAGEMAGEHKHSKHHAQRATVAFLYSNFAGYAAVEGCLCDGPQLSRRSQGRCLHELRD